MANKTIEANGAAPSTLHPMLDHLLDLLVRQQGSDLHIQADQAPRVRVNGKLRKVGEWVPAGRETEALARSLLSDDGSVRLAGGSEIDIAVTDKQHGRFRVHIFRQMGTIAISFRRVVTDIPTFSSLGVPEVARSLAEAQRGLILVTGPTGSGKTTTLAAMIDHINRNRECHIVTIEDPVEVVHRPDLAEISQREVGTDTADFATAMRAAMREDPDVILVGEMRDLETVSAALTAAETGHLVLSTLHTTDAVETINRIVDFYPPHQQHQVRVSLAGSLKGIVGQRLVPTVGGNSRVPAVEVLVNNGRVQQCVVEGHRADDLFEIMRQGDYYGMCTFDQSLARLAISGDIDTATAALYASKPHDLQLELARQTASAALEPLV